MEKNSLHTRTRSKNHLLNRSLLLITLGILSCFPLLEAQDYYGRSDEWVAKAEALKPELSKEVIKPLAVVDIVKDENAFQGYKAVNVSGMDEVYNQSFKNINQVIIDFGDHYTGYFTFNLEAIRGTSDAPTRFKLTFGEVSAELATPFDPYHGDLSRAWLQDEVITVMDIPNEVSLDRRVSFRYLKIELLGSSQFFDFKISDMHFTAETSAKNDVENLGAGFSDQIRAIDRISRNTLKECMQTVYEDGPKRDRRLWVGDMYLESLANIYSFQNHQLTQRCLYLFAGLTDPNGYVLGTVFETPEPHPQEGQRLMDYSLLYNVSLLEYLEATKDYETAKDLWPVAKRQLAIVKEYVKEDGLIDYPRANGEWWLFIDWKNGLNKEVAIQGVIIYALEMTQKLAKELDKEEEIKEIPDLIAKMKKAAMTAMYNKKTGLFESGNEKQISIHSQVWMTIAGVPSQKQSQKAFKAINELPEALYPGGPYMYHYYIQALINAGMNNEAKNKLLEYWGAMVDKGADTFWEVFDPKDDFLSPYNFFPVNSYCHAWSCTPVYFIRKYPEIFGEN